MLLSKLTQDIVTDSVIAGNIDISNIETNTEKNLYGGLYICLQSDEDKIIANLKIAGKRGATCALVSKKVEMPLPQIVCPNIRAAAATVYANYYGNPQKKIKFIGITGTNGKTTTATLIYHLLNSNGIKTALIGTNGDITDSQVRTTGYTTPVPEILFEEIACALQDDCEYLVMEVSSHALDQDRVYPIQFDYAVFTNLTRDHLDYHKDMDSYASAKKKLFLQAKLGIINTDDIYANIFIDACTSPPVTYGIHSQARFTAADIMQYSDRVEFTLCLDADCHKVMLPLPGIFSVYNGLAAISVCKSVGLDIFDILKGLKTFGGVAGRMESIATPFGFDVIIDYAHTPDGLENVLKAAAAFAKGRVIVLFGCGGNRDKGKRSQMCEVAAKLSDYMIITSDNPRDENPFSIIRDILSGLNGFEIPFAVIENRREATEFALHEAQTGDIVILAGKGHENYQIVGGRRYDYDEKSTVLEIIEQMRGSER